MALKKGTGEKVAIFCWVLTVLVFALLGWFLPNYHQVNTIWYWHLFCALVFAIPGNTAGLCVAMIVCKVISSFEEGYEPDYY